MKKSLVIKVIDTKDCLNKNTLLASFLSVFVYMSFFFHFISPLSAQIIIKEKVEINPQQNIIPEYPESSLDPCLNISRPDFHQSVYSCSGYPVEPYQQNYPWQAVSYLTQLDSSTVYNVEIISGTEYAYFYKVGYWDNVNNIQVYPEYIGSSLENIMGYELAGWGEYIVNQWVGVWERAHFALYNIRFDNYDMLIANVTVRITNTVTNEITQWHTTIVNPQYTLNDPDIDGDTVLHMRDVFINPDIYNSLSFSCNQFGYGSCPPSNVSFSIEIIQGEEYGKIGKYNDYFGSYEYAPAYTGLSYDEFKYGTYVFAANGLQPDSTAEVRIRQSSSDADIGSIEYVLIIRRNFLPPISENGSIVIETNKNTAMPGDTLEILLKCEDGANGIVDFSEWQEFSVWLADGFDYGTLLYPVTGDTSDDFDVIGKELKLVIDQSVIDANKKIVIAAETEIAILGGDRIIRNNPSHTIMPQSSDKKVLNNKPIEQNGFVKQRDIVHSQDMVEYEIYNPDVVVGSRYLSGIKEITVNPLIVVIDPPIVSAGDTARIIPQYMDSTGSYIGFDSLQTFELGILDGCPLGYLSAETDSNQYFYGVKQPFHFIADSSADSGVVSIRVGVIEIDPQNSSLLNNNNYIYENDNPISCSNIDFVEDLYVNTDIPIEEKYEILLGETKYYQVRYSDLLNGKLLIDELSGPYYWEDMGTSIKQDVWGDKPVTIVDGSDKLGVYWEKEKPVWESNVKKGKLPIGLIRLIGRYWEEGKTYKVKLTAHTPNGETASIEIEVKKPGILGGINNTVKDVFSNDINIDNLCIINSGILGLPPQIVKGHMEKETTFRNSFRYEPRLDISVQNNVSARKKYLEDFTYYTVTPNSMGSIPMPNNHDNVRPVPYVTTPIKISNYMFDNIGNYIRRARKNKEGKWLPPYFVGYQKGKPTTMLVQYYNYALNELNKDRSQAMDYAISEIKKWLLTEQFIDGKKYAQTRIFSSYGMLQQVFYYACTDKIANYSINNEMQEPESLNEFDYVFNAYHHKMGKKLSSKPLNQWQLGFEEELISIFQSYNPNEAYYGQKVFNFSFQYLPKNNRN